jgi:isoleucyl-tRNA synthetase
LLDKWKKIKSFKAIIAKELETKRSEGIIGSSLQAMLTINVEPELYKILSSLGDELKYVYMVSGIKLSEAASNSITATNINAPKCNRCWHYDISVGSNSANLEICFRCYQNTNLNGEQRYYA